ncbi:MAG: hypothetical protein A4E53_02597 [Pelotomaculum sp. PtaB.Bin104]|nr:MAG: hypothetical protein A4E53_02597 [Pelotomaculum sp. PtaB.Bin104]
MTKARKRKALVETGDNMGNLRIWEIDLFRSMAIVLMVIFHTVVDLNRYYGTNIDYLNGFWYWEGKASALIFIFLAGLSSGFSKDNLTRGGKVLAYGMLITLLTYIFFKEQYIRFGILHLLGISMLLFPLVIKMNNLLLLICAAVIAFAAIPVQSALVNTSLLLPFGVMYRGFTTLDYYPLIPYFSVFMLGIVAYRSYYYQKRSLYRVSFNNKYITTLSKHSLAIYLIHQPVIIAIVFLYRVLTNSKI